ncbi:hypothetical protein F5Y03DRAFT_336850 [Xylaria venustula]|nr:hypothetical protein F5Y03DRAFT_336850 [Xylaria venustula]
MGWEPLLDPDRPACPYLPGFVIHATEHEPPPAFGRDYPPKTRRDPPDGLIDRMTQTQLVLDYPPQDTRWTRSAPPRTATLTIMKRIPNGRDRHAKLVVCRVLVKGHHRPYTAVAKIYDALHYSPEDSLERYVTMHADWDYSWEALAYASLQTPKHPQKPGFAPEYYGSWTFDSTLTWQGKAHKRSIRLILIEHIRGASISNLYTRKHPDSQPDAFHFPEAYRLDILAEIYEGVVKQEHAGISQRDLAPRNVMLAPSPQGGKISQALPRVVLIDYNQATVWKHTKLALYWERKDQPLPLNPGQYFWDYPLDEFRGWYPAEWDRGEQGLKSYQDWLLAKFVWNQTDFAPIKKDHPSMVRLDRVNGDNKR